jgi:hypothetical protein
MVKEAVTELQALYVTPERAGDLLPRLPTSLTISPPQGDGVSETQSG